MQEAHYPIDNKTALDDLHTRYKQIYGSIKKAIRFFEALDDKTKKLIQEKFQVYKGGQRQSSTDEDLAKLFYKIRNNFIHNADLVVPFSSPQQIERIRNDLEISPSTIIPPIWTWFSIGDKKISTCLSFENIKLIFERGFLIYFNYDKAKFKPK